MEKRKVILDCDPGHDDAVAIIMAGRHTLLDLLGITVVAGNQTLEKTARNALNTCQHLDLDVPVHAGMSRPMVRDQIIADDHHGESGLDGPVFETLNRKIESEHAVMYLINTLLKSDGDITLTPTGPLTNIAMAMRLEPAIIPKIREIVLMGGAYQLGNVTPAAEFNILADAEAAHIVFSSGSPIVMMGLDITNQVQCTYETVARMEKIGNKASKLFAEMMGFFIKSQQRIFGFSGGPLHDPTCVAWLIDSSCIELKEMYTEVEIRSEKCYGRTICDYFGVTGNKPNSRVAVAIDQARFWDIVEECLGNYS